MQTRFLLHKGVTVRPGHDVLPPSITDEEYRELMAGEDRYLMTEANTLADLEATFFYDDPVHWQSSHMLEAITSSRLQLSRTMKAFIRALNQKLTGTGLQAGSNNSGGPVQDGATEIGGADIGRARNINGLPVLPAIIPLSDGQTVSILFHSPTADGKITNNDTLVAFQFLLNKKDVTHTVAPMSGQDMTLAQVTMKLANLAEKNSTKFQRAQKKQKALTDEINQLQADSDQKEDALSDVSDQAEAVNSQVSDLQQQVSATSNQAAAIEAENNDLQTQVDALTKTGGKSAGVPVGQEANQPKIVT
ncbi:antirestriction phage head protein DarA, partial [Bacillus altitudinis]|uniref:antirestriction phage head protein DarA n=1 Tax=Bacillus altitudinis TaxID=293387 RepID=UPI00366B8D4B